MEEEFIITVGKSGKPQKIKQSVDIKNNDVKAKYISIDGHVLSYNGYDVTVFTDEKNEMWWKAITIVKIIGYVASSSDKMVRNYISDCNKINYGELLDNNPSKNSGLKISKNDAKSVYINTSGIFELLGKSKKKEAKKFQFWLYNDVLPTINKTGKYNMKIDKEFEIVPSNEYQDWALTNNLTDVKNKRIIYLGAIGVIKSLNSDIETNVKEGEMLFKYGITSREDKRQKEHIASMDSYICFYVKKCMRNDDLERDLEDELKRKGLRRHLKIGNNNYTELFATSPNFTIDDVKKYIDDWIEKNDYKLGTSELELAKELTKQKEADILCEKEKTKQEEAKSNAIRAEFEYKKMELEYKISQEKKLECNVQKIKK